MARRSGVPGLVLAALAAYPGAPAGGAQSPAPDRAGSEFPKALLGQYCLACHNEKLKTAGVELQRLRPDAIGEDAALWERVLRKVRTGEMPPPGMPRPPASIAASFAQWLENQLDRAAAAHPNPGRPAIHRLNRAEYSNAIRDLLALDLDVGASLPPDDSGYGFDNIADVLTVSPLHMEKYMAAARRVSRLAIGDVKVRPSVERFAIERNVPQQDRVSDDLPFGSRGGTLIRRYFPLDAEYSIRVAVRGGPTRDAPRPKLDFRLDGARIKLLDVQISEREEDAESRFYEVRAPVKAGSHEVGVTFLQEYWKPEAIEEQRRPGPPPRPSVDYVLIGGPFNPTGPGETESRRRIFVCRPERPEDEEPCARKILASLARRAYRRPVTGDDIAPLLRLFGAGRREGGSFDAGIELALRSMLVSPSFLFRIERNPPGSRPGTVHRISDVELASRLSFFLWSSIPDGELLDLAEQGRLREPEVLQRQVRRMLADRRSEALVTNFAGQWLHLRNLAMVKPDPERFPEFDEALRRAFRRETEMFFETILREDRSLLDFLSADYTFVNERLARHYQIPGVKGNYFRRVSLAGVERRGVLTHGSILTVTSYPTRTSPVIRGKWILENLLGAPPPPPPPDVPELKESEAGAPASLRQQLEKHRASPSCASCHARMDPPGFALENFDAVGKWRTQDGASEIDASAALPGGETFRGPRELTKVLLGRRQEFLECLTEKLLTYALGRGLEYYDRPAVRAITREVERNDYRFSALILAIVNSTPFQMRRTPDP